MLHYFLIYGKHIHQMMVYIFCMKCQFGTENTCAYYFYLKLKAIEKERLWENGRKKIRKIEPPLHQFWHFVSTDFVFNPSDLHYSSFLIGRMDKTIWRISKADSQRLIEMRMSESEVTEISERGVSSEDYNHEKATEYE